MTGILRYINWITGIFLLVCISCNDNEKIHSNDKNGEEAEVKFVLLTIPKTYATTDPGSGSERAIHEVDILVFKNDEYQYRKEASKDGNSYRATLLVDDGLTLYFIVNNRLLLDSSDQLIEGYSWENQIRTSLIMKDPVSLIGSSSLPMWGIKEDVNIIADTENEFTDIHLLRAVASVDIYNGEDPETFSLTEAYLYFVPDQGYVAPSEINYDPTEKSVTATEAPVEMQNYADKVGVTSAENERITHQLYLYENDAVSSDPAGKRYSRVVVGGSFEGEATTYYPVDLLEDDLSKILQATRNYKYVIYITKVGSSGYVDPGTASEAEDSRLDTDVIEWNLKDENELVFKGKQYISLESKYVYLYRPAGSSRTLSMTTSIDPSELQMEFLDAGNGTQVDMNQYKIQNDRFLVEILFDENNEIEAIYFEALGDYDPQDLSRNFQVLRIYSSEVEMEVTIEQVNESPTDWIDGGTNEVEVGDNEKAL